MNITRLAASVVTLLSGAVGAYAGYTSPAPEGNQLLVEGLGVVLIVVSLGCFYGARTAFAGSAVVSGVFAFVAAVGWGGLELSATQWGALGLALVNVVLSVLAFRSSSAIPEQANPMNLPVFG